MRVDVEQEQDGRWLAEVSALPGAMAYAGTKQEAVARVEALVQCILADKMEHGEGAVQISPYELKEDVPPAPPGSLKHTAAEIKLHNTFGETL